MSEFYKKVYLISLFFMMTDSLTYFYGDGSYFVGDVDMSGRPEHGQLYNNHKVLQYNGSFSDGVYHGNGSWYGHNGHLYQGQFHNGQANGEGVWTTDKGEMIEGKFLNHSVNGRAVWSWPELGLGVRMEGEFKRGHAHGEGVMYYGDGTRFEGTFKKGYPHGEGKLVSGKNNSIIWSGSLNNGWPEGEISPRIKELFKHFHTHQLRNVYWGREIWAPSG